MKETDAAWLAGYIDGDGCITIGGTGRRYRSLLLVIDSTDIELLHHVMEIAGGYLQKKKVYKSHHRQGWTWRLLGGSNITAILTAVYPHLRCAFKKERARMVIEEWAACTPRNGHYTEDIRVRKVEFERKFLVLGEGRGKRSLSNGKDKTTFGVS